ncbi:MAG: hypothetical protein EXQ81_09945 [Thermoleophilia bacterium]|nr:hypothetical protein [Thermoleophilia bacterium]
MVGSLSRSTGGGERGRHAIQLWKFVAVIAVVEAMNVILTNRVDALGLEQQGLSAELEVVQVVEGTANILFVAFLFVAVVQVILQRRNPERGSSKRIAPTMMVVYLGIASFNVAMNILVLVLVPDLQDASQTDLIGVLALIFLSNMLIFSLWYQLADYYLPGGAFDFPPNAAYPDDPPRWVDYVSLSFFTQSTFGPTLEGVRTRPAKVLMMLQTSLALVVLVVLIARIIRAPV